MSSLTTNTKTENTVKMVVTEIIGSHLCIAIANAQKVNRAIAAAFKEGKKVILSFKNAEDLTWGFLSDSIGQLYVDFPEREINNSLSFVDISDDDLEFIEDVIYWKKEFLKDPERYKEAAREFLEVNDD